MEKEAKNDFAYFWSEFHDIKGYVMALISMIYDMRDQEEERNREKEKN